MLLMLPLLLLLSLQFAIGPTTVPAAAAAA